MNFKEFLNEKKLSSSVTLNNMYFKQIKSLLRSKTYKIEKQRDLTLVIYDDNILAIKDNHIVGFNDTGSTTEFIRWTKNIKSIKEIPNILALGGTPVQAKELGKGSTSQKIKYVVKDRAELKQIIKDADDNADLNYLDVTKVEDMNSMFEGFSFNGDISKWDVSNVKYMQFMFHNSKFNGDLSKWNVSNVEDMSYMFKGSPLDGNEPDWYNG